MNTKLLIIITLLITGWTSVGAQYVVIDNDFDDPRSKMRLGIRAGLNFGTLYDSKGDDFSSETRTGLAAGGFLSVPISQFLGFQPELIYSQKGFKGSGNLLIANYEYSRNLDYLDIPLQLQIKPAPYLTLVAGPQFSFLLRKGFDFKSGSITIDQQTEIENSNIRKNTLGAVAGVDIILMHFVVSGRLDWDLQHNNGDGTSTSPRYKLMVVQITAGIIF